MIQRLMEKDGLQPEPVEGKSKKIHALHPLLCNNIWELANTNKDVECLDWYLPQEARCAIKKVSISKRRVFVMCMARLLLKKSPHNFIALLQRLGGVEFLREHELIPLMCGARSIKGYAKKVVGGFCEMLSSSTQKFWPCVVIDHNIGTK